MAYCRIAYSLSLNYILPFFVASYSLIVLVIFPRTYPFCVNFMSACSCDFVWLVLEHEIKL